MSVRRWRIRWRHALLLAAVALAALAAVPAVRAVDRSPLREFRGTIVAVDRAHHAFRIHDAQGRTIRFRVHGGTRYADCAWGTLQSGRRVDVHARHAGAAWQVTRVEGWHGGWSHHAWAHHDADHH